MKFGADDFSRLEFAELRAEITRKSAAIDKVKVRVQIVTVVVLLLVYVRIFPVPGAKPDLLEITPDLAFYLTTASFLFVAFCWLDIRVSRNHIEMMGRYLRWIELYNYGHVSFVPMGWETYLRNAHDSEDPEMKAFLLDLKTTEQGSSAASQNEFVRQHAMLMVFAFANLLMCADNLRKWMGAG